MTIRAKTGPPIAVRIIMSFNYRAPAKENYPKKDSAELGLASNVNGCELD
jgi:hypothetical protein